MNLVSLNQKWNCQHFPPFSWGVVYYLYRRDWVCLWGFLRVAWKQFSLQFLFWVNDILPYCVLIIFTNRNFPFVRLEFFQLLPCDVGDAVPMPRMQLSAEILSIPVSSLNNRDAGATWTVPSHPANWIPTVQHSLVLCARKWSRKVSDITNHTNCSKSKTCIKPHADTQSQLHFNHIHLGRNFYCQLYYRASHYQRLRHFILLHNFWSKMWAISGNSNF